ncbi:lipopolysaccharide kinase InaA family protein [Variovorax sp. EL159]|uniref:lipopolysaccharide kinase InaA family protein n=1 Tax=Variovorax sp. EL159 TaxID=1566270 RepID=UPI00087F8A04|nr:lipopolysaccharide kinase InaA family protein [Variovorax sp. EL159]SCX58243.1 Lipopolysaccharide kinase (Kdo/WaaP) family protein [Variovorax sp. EL159]
MLSLLTLSCPQCSAPLPRAARWRTVNCSYCGATITRGEETVERESFRAAWRRANADVAGGRILTWRQARYCVLAPLATGEHSEVLLAERLGALPERVTFKLARDSAANDVLAREGAVLQALQALSVPGAAYFTRRMPQPLGVGVAEGLGDGARQALVLRHPTGFWGSLQDVLQANPEGIDPRHAVWIWRRMLEVLAFVHGAGWTHRDLSPAHALVHPRDHGVLLIGWSRAQHASASAHAAAVARDLMQAAWTVRALLHGGAAGEPGLGAHTPAPLATLLRQCSEDAAICTRLGAQGIEQSLSNASREAFGAPQFVHFDPAPRAGA